ncbi:MAG: hypothetical protein EBU26_14660 [Verrucomicrobia bacterium]|nr:hypothetical protein [Verrucomicrobiota bacterium]
MEISWEIPLPAPPETMETWPTWVRLTVDLFYAVLLIGFLYTWGIGFLTPSVFNQTLAIRGYLSLMLVLINAKIVTFAWIGEDLSYLKNAIYLNAVVLKFGLLINLCKKDSPLSARIRGELPHPYWKRILLFPFSKGRFPGMLWLLGLRLNNRPWQQPSVPVRQWMKLRPLAMIALVLLVCQITLGGWTSSNYAALACPDLPTCQGRWLPPMDFASGFNVTQEIGPNYLGGQMDGEARVAIHMAHRIGALLVTLLLGFLIWKLYRNAGGRELTLLTHVLLFLLIMQVSLGISNIVFSLPLWVAVAHNAGGALLLLTLVTLNYRLNKVSAF